VETVTTTLGIQNVDTQLYVGLLQLSNQSTGKACQQTILHTLKVHRRTIAGQNNLFTITEQMVEDMEERIERLGRIHPLLNIIDNQYIDRLIEVDEVVSGVLADRIRKLHLEQTGADIEHTLMRISLLATYANGIDEVSLTTTRRTIEEEGVKGGLTRMLSNGESNGA